MIKLFCILLLISSVLAGCAGANVKPIVDMKGVNQVAYDKDLQECQTIAQQQSGMGESVRHSGRRGRSDRSPSVSRPPPGPRPPGSSFPPGPG